MRDFGVIIVCHRHDYYLAKGCCASVRHFLGEVPILLLVDGDFSTREVESVYGVSILKCRDVADPDVRERSSGWGLTKMIAFWHSPWSRFLLLDADTVVWGDVTRLARFDAADMVIDCHLAQLFPQVQVNGLLSRFLGGPFNDAKLLSHVRRWYFDPVRLARYDPFFPIEQCIECLFCSGAILARRGVIDRKAYLACLDASLVDPGLFGPGEMGLLNYLVLRAEVAGTLRVHRDRDLQTLVHLVGDAEMAERFPVIAQEMPTAVTRPTVLHWSGWRKPLARSQHPRGAPMTFFRRKLLRDRGCSRVQAAAALAAEDYGRMARFHGPVLLGACFEQGRRAFGRLAMTRPIA